MNLPPPSKPRDVPNAGALDRARGHVMAVSLKALLDRVRGAREALPHLAMLELALDHEGLDALERASFPVLSRICSQLASLPVADNDAPLQDLQSRLLLALERRGRASPAAEPAVPSHPAPAASSPLPDPPRATAPAAASIVTPVVESFGSALVVSELSHSAFMRVMQESEV